MTNERADSALVCVRQKEDTRCWKQWREHVYPEAFGRDQYRRDT